MLKLFEPNYKPTSGTYIPSQSRPNTVRAELTVNTLINYFSRSAFRLPGNHLLVQLVKALQYSLETPFENVVQSVYARAPYVANHFNLTSVLAFGTPHKSVFYGHRNNDVVDYVFSSNLVDVDPFSKDESWTELSPLKVIHHPCTDFRMLLPHGQNDVPWSGYSVVQLDLPLLALQYHKFQHEMKLKFDNEAVSDPNKFIVTRVLPKLYKSHFDYVTVNLFSVQLGTMEKVTHNRWLPIALPDMDKPMEQMVKEVFKKVVNTRRPFINLLETIPSFFHGNGLNFLQMPVEVPVKQLNWLTIMSRQPVMEYLLDVQGKPGRDVNRAYISDFKRDASAFLNARNYEYVRPLQNREKLIDFLEKVQYL